MKRLMIWVLFAGLAGPAFADEDDDDERVRVEEQEARSSIGSGDAFLAGYVAARYAGSPPIECLRFGVACGAESTQHFGAGIIDPARVERLRGEVEAERLEIGAEIS